MRFFKKKIFFITSIVCLLPIIAGLILWNKLPDSVPIHFDMYNNPDNFAPKWFAVFGLPIFMVVLQAICCVINDINAAKHGERVKLERATKWIIPIMSVLLCAVTYIYALGVKLDIRICVTMIVGVILIVIGNYLPKFDYIKNYDINTEKARIINRFIGFETVIMGILFLVSLFFPPMATIVCLILLIPYAIIAISYGIYICKKK
ncbi:MAG: DUF1648 domain-containing protein [Ruminococcaceae bacterium]|nr:DUF1648 domain-containing protein [Oscillospiraceae bacterium]